ncbi:MAG: MBOAT family protein [Alphaproteobacteria bacterium]|nr:MBOAT family protein [Alphaproteobacteria bacterium]
MSFVDTSFVGFFAVVFAVYWLLASQRRLQNVVLLLASVVFYAWIHPWMAFLLLGSALLDYVCALRIADHREHGNRWMVVSVVGNIGTLAFFKYNDFFVASTADALSAMGFAVHTHTLGIFLPIGLSFYTFQTMAYTIDVWREQLDVRRDLLDYLVFVCFFPQLVAGPVERASNLLPQVEQPRRFDVDQIASGLGLALFGAFKKVVIADTMAPYVNAIFAVPEPSWAMIWAAALGFTIQVLADFSGYTDMARGCARMLGFELMENFDHPYLATSPMDFWRRWHISFSTWLRDYVYMPLSFAPWVRRWLTIPGTGYWTPFWHTARALTITMFLSGLWHGSTWNYVVWGLYYAVIGTAWVGIQQRVPRKTRKSRDWRPVLVPTMFVFTVMGMMIFREPSVARVIQHFFSNPFAGTADQWLIAGSMLAICAAGAVPMIGFLLFDLYVRPHVQDHPWFLPVRTASWTIAVICLFVFVRPTQEDFIYFQF